MGNMLTSMTQEVEDSTDGLTTSGAHGLVAETPGSLHAFGTEFVALVQEVDELQRHLPDYARILEGLQRPRLVTNSDGSLIWPGTSDIHYLDLHVVVHGGPECEAYDAPFRLRLRFSKAWPHEPPLVRFCSIIHHGLVDADDRAMLYSFYASLPREADGRYTLRGLLATIHAVLVNPRSIAEASNPLGVEGLLTQMGAAPRYEGSLKHPALGQGSFELHILIHSRVSEMIFNGKWEAMGKSGPASVYLDPVRRELRVQGETPLGTIQLEGNGTNESGNFSGACLLSATPGGEFELRPVEAGDETLAQERRNAQRLKVIKSYEKLVKHPELFRQDPVWFDEWFDHAFLRARQASRPEAWYELLSEHVAGQVFSFPFFSEAFCEIFVEEILNFYSTGLPARRPNSMNNYGIILSEIGLERWVDGLQSLLQPLGELLWPGPGTGWDGHHCFIVRYKEGEDLGLDMHTDDSDVTFNVCLGLKFGGAGLQFCGMAGMPDHRKQTYTYNHIRGRCLVHLGRHRHGADDITWGDRMNLILWNHSSAYRKSKDFDIPSYEREEGPPDITCLSYTHDRDFGAFRSYKRGQEEFAARAWCPPRHAEYEGFQAGVMGQ